MREEEKLGDMIANLDYAKSFSDNFDSFIAFTLFPFLANPDKEDVANYMSHREYEKYKEAMLKLGDISEGYHDALGDIFMDRISHGANGQFFTPDCICEFMSAILSPEGEHICDPCCGSGRLLLKGLQRSRENKLDPTIYGGDLDHRAARMTLLNLCMNSARGDVEWINSLSNEVFKTYHIDRVNLYGHWMSYVWQYTPSTNMDELNSQRQDVIRQLMEGGVWYEMHFEDPKKQAEPSEADTQQAPMQSAAQPTEIPPIPEPKRQQAVQLSLFD